jgi:exosome complex component RRP42
MESYALELIRKGRRVDGRKFDEFRKVEVKAGVVGKAEGSASVKIGETEVIAGVKMEIGTPYLDSPNEGVLIVSAEFSPIASPNFEAGPPTEDAVELARVVDRGLRESECIELDKLCLEPAKKCWMVFVDIHIINHQGNLLDASALASLVALLNTKIPKIEGEKIIRGEYTGKLPVVHKPINITVGKVGEQLILDPNIEEEEILDSKLAVAVREDDKICALQKQGRKGFGLVDVERMVDVAITKSKEIRELIKWV